jgi:glycosyltransferase involved in cell wall biosynthesis
MRVLQCIDTLGGGGAERQFTYLVEGLVRIGHEVDVVYMLDGAHGERLRASGATIHPLGWRATLPLVADLYRLIRQRRVDVVQTWLGRMNVAGGAAGRLARRPWLYSERTVRALYSGWRAAVRLWLGRSAAAVVANSEAGAAPWRATAGARVHVVPNAIDLDAIDEVAAIRRADLGLTEEVELILYAGRFAPPKNIPLLTAALTGILRTRPRALALLCGEGEELAGFRAAVERAGVGARCLTFGYRSDLWALLKTADVTIAPSRYEGRPNVVLEAMACGCPLVLSDIAPHRECVPADSALWFSSGSPAEAAAALERCLADRTEARVRATRARAAACGQSVDEMARAYCRVYEQMTARAGAAI